MKKTLSILLCALLIAALAGCGGSKAETPAGPTQTPAVTEAPEATDAPAVTEAPAEPSPDGNGTAELVAKILTMVGQPVEDLYDLIGQPKSSDYTPSCLVTGGQDGQLEYDGFTVYTLVQPDGTETIYDCE